MHHTLIYHFFIAMGMMMIAILLQYKDIDPVPPSPLILSLQMIEHNSELDHHTTI
jgi:hypothetical protein